MGPLSRPKPCNGASPQSPWLARFREGLPWVTSHIFYSPTTKVVALGTSSMCHDPSPRSAVCPQSRQSASPPPQAAREPAVYSPTPAWRPSPALSSLHALAQSAHVIPPSPSCPRTRCRPTTNFAPASDASPAAAMISSSVSNRHSSTTLTRALIGGFDDIAQFAQDLLVFAIA